MLAALVVCGLGRRIDWHIYGEYNIAAQLLPLGDHFEWFCENYVISHYQLPIFVCDYDLPQFSWLRRKGW